MKSLLINLCLFSLLAILPKFSQAYTIYTSGTIDMGDCEISWTLEIYVDDITDQTTGWCYTYDGCGNMGSFPAHKEGNGDGSLLSDWDIIAKDGDGNVITMNWDAFEGIHWPVIAPLVTSEE